MSIQRDSLYQTTSNTPKSHSYTQSQSVRQSKDSISIIEHKSNNFIHLDKQESNNSNNSLLDDNVDSDEKRLKDNRLTNGKYNPKSKSVANSQDHNADTKDLEFTNKTFGKGTETGVK